MKYRSTGTRLGLATDDRRIEPLRVGSYRILRNAVLWLRLLPPRLGLLRPRGQGARVDPPLPPPLPVHASAPPGCELLRRPVSACIRGTFGWFSLSFCRPSPSCRGGLCRRPLGEGPGGARRPS
eukprot:2689435-Rhodomonas_salina.5